MKKLLSIIIAIVLSVTAFSGCSQKNDAAKIEKLITSAMELNGKLNDLNLTSVTSMYYDYGSTNYSIKTTSELLVHNLNNPDKYEMSEIVSQQSSSSATATKYEVYYKDGYYFTNRYGGAFKSKLNAKETGIENIGSLVNIKYSDMRSVGFKTDDDKWGKGYTAVSFTCKNSVLEKFIDRTSDNNADDYEDVKINKGEGEYVVDKDGYLVYEKLEVVSTITTEGEEVVSKISSEVTYNEVGKDVDPYNPEEKNYVEIDNMQDAVGINSAMGKTLSSNNYVMDMTAEADIVQDETNAGYKRTFKRQQDMTDGEYAQSTYTTYLADGEEGDTLESSQYYTDGRYYQKSDMYSQKIYCVMDFSKFVSRVYMQAGVSPASVYSTGMMKDIKSEKLKDDTVYSFNVNTESEDGLTFVSSIVGPYENFGGNFADAEIKVNSFEGKTYVNKQGYYYKTEISCDILVKFSEGDVGMKFNQVLTASNIGDDVKCEFPELNIDDYERMEQADLLGAFSGSGTSSTTE